MFIKIVIVCLAAVILHHAWTLLGSEDMKLLKNGLVLISSGLTSFGTFRQTEDVQPGRLLLFDFNNPNEVEELKLPSAFDNAPLDPHGITVWQTPDSDVVTVFVVNHHNNSGDSIEKFHLDLSSHRLSHVETIIQPEMRSINDVVAVSDTSFYATLDFGFHSDYGRLLEIFLMLKYGQVLFYNGSTTRTVVNLLLYPNGIDISLDGKFVYLSEITKRVIHVFQRDTRSNDLQLVQTYQTYTKSDNVIVDEEGHLWAGCHPNSLKIMAHLRNGSVPIPSQVLRLKTHNGLITSMSEVYSDEGHTLYGSTSAIYHKKQLLIGTIRHKLLLCDVLYLQ